jgi:AICAR transformylase/IMP cyclohydrolase PurH
MTETGGSLSWKRANARTLAYTRTASYDLAISSYLPASFPTKIWKFSNRLIRSEI